MPIPAIELLRLRVLPSTHLTSMERNAHITLPAPHYVHLLFISFAIPMPPARFTAGASAALWERRGDFLRRGWGGKMKTSLRALLAMCLLCGVASKAAAWETSLVGSGKFSFGYGLAVKVDSAGSVVGVGALSNSGGDLDFIVLKFSASGSELWRKAIRGTATGSSLAITNEAKAVAVAGDGSIAAAGFTGNTGTGADFTVVKLDGNGNELWRRVINGSANVADEARAVSFDGSGNIIAAGLLANSATGKDFFIVKFDASGNELWRYTLNGSANTDDQANGLAVDASGNVFAAGNVTNTGTGSDFAVVKVSGATGAEVWRSAINGINGAAPTDVANAIALDGAGNAFVAGEIFRGFDPNDNLRIIITLIVKFDGANGNELWHDSNSLLDNHINTRDHANAIAIDASGNPVITGQDHWSDTGDVHNSILVQKYDGTNGTVLFRRLIDGRRHGEGFSIALDSGGNIYIAGDFSSTAEPLFDTQEFAVIKFPASGADFSTLWTRTINANGGSDVAFAVAIDGAGNPVAVGTIESFAGDTDENYFTVVKLDAANGADIWLQFIVGTGGAGANAGLAVALDSAGDILTAGYLQNTGGRLDFSVAKLDRETGDELWRASIKGDALDDDKALAIAVDAAGNAIAAGYLVNEATGPDFAVAKFDGGTGAEIWRKVIEVGSPANNHDRATDVAVDGQG
ncbi:MAG TPA: PQQ-binding-like beta-propeller repeat protein, partial [Verrucomicrobiae bacterium]|nr:PQQ-binding-like beta-propeller repeat protein [Verrucomicrobiae bacterium]